MATPPYNLSLPRIAALCFSVALLSLCQTAGWASPATHGATKPTYTEIQVYTFTDQSGDGAWPETGLTPGNKGVFFGATSGGGDCGGNIFELIPNTSGGYDETPIFEFDCFGKGGAPSQPLLADSRDLFGVAGIGGANNAGIVYKLVHHSTGWKEKILYTFAGGSDGSFPVGPLIADGAGNLYGVTLNGGGSCDCGTVYKLAPGQSGYAESILYAFQGGSDGSEPAFGLLMGRDGSLYGTTDMGGPANVGTVFQLKPNGNGYTKSTLYGFQGGSDGEWVESGLIADSTGALYGTTGYGGAHGQGAVYKIVPAGKNSTESVIYSFKGADDGIEAAGGVIMDAQGNLYGTTAQGGASDCSGLDGCGTAYELKLQTSGSYKKRTLYSFGAAPDGNTPEGGLVFGKHHTLFGTTLYGGSQYCDDGGCGTVFELSR